MIITAYSVLPRELQTQNPKANLVGFQPMTPAFYSIEYEYLRSGLAAGWDFDMNST